MLDHLMLIVMPPNPSILCAGGVGYSGHGAQQPPPEDPVPPQAEAGAGGDAA